MISRIWHGYTSHENADKYERMLREEIFVGIREKEINGFLEIQLNRRDLENEVEFVTIMWFSTIEAVKEFAGEDYEQSVVPEKARKVLKRFDERSQHYEVKASVKI